MDDLLEYLQEDIDPSFEVADEYIFIDDDEDRTQSFYCRFGCGREAIDQFGCCDSPECLMQMVESYPEMMLGR